MCVIIFILIIGLTIGSFLNVCIGRIPKKKSILFPPSHCPYCGQPLCILDLIPVISFLILRGHCNYCNRKISIRYPIVEVLNPILYIILFYKFEILFIPYSIFVSLWLVIFFIDLENQIIPNSLNLTGFVLSVSFKIIESLYLNSYMYLVDAVLGAIIGALPLFIIIKLTDGGIGAGDMKLMVWVGIILGLKFTYYTLIMGIISASIVSIFLVILNIKNLKSSLPFAPFLTTAAFINLIWGEILFT